MKRQEHLEFLGRHRIGVSLEVGSVVTEHGSAQVAKRCFDVEHVHLSGGTAGEPSHLNESPAPRAVEIADRVLNCLD
jgi:hypothetical protein